MVKSLFQNVLNIIKEGENIEESYVKSPLSYTGGKYKLLSQIIPLFPKQIHRFVDLFGGGFNVGSNVKADIIVYNDIIPNLVDLLKEFYQREPKIIEEIIDDCISRYDLKKYYGDDKSIKEFKKLKYMELRSDYNKNPDWIKFYALISCSFNNQIRFNSNKEFNQSYGDRDFNIKLKQNLNKFINCIQSKKIEFYNKRFNEFTFNKGDFVYCDPPYFGSIANYNDGKRGFEGWTEWHENKLHEIVAGLNDRDIQFALSANLKYDNPFLVNWMKNYNIHYLNADYHNCNYAKKDKNKQSKDNEVLITNY